MKKTKEELVEYKHKMLVILQDTFAAYLLGMIDGDEYAKMTVLMSGMLHAIFHEGGEHTFNCDKDEHDITFEKIDELYEGVMLDRKESNDVISWVDNPEKQKALKDAQRAQLRTALSELDDDETPPSSGHLH